MQRYVLLAANLALLICSVAFDPSRAHAQNNAGSSPITFDVTMKLELSADDRSYVHLLMQGKYEINPLQLAPTSSPDGVYVRVAPQGKSEVGPQQLSTSGIKDGQTFTIYLKYLGGQMLRGEGAGQGYKFNFVDDSAVKKVQYYSGVGDGMIRGPYPDGSALILLKGGPGFRMPSGDESDAAAIALGCWIDDWPLLTISYAELRNLDKLNREWSGAATPPEVAGCHGTATVHIRAVGKEEDTKVALPGCTNLAVGQSAVLTAIGQPDGGSFRYWAEPSGPLSIQQAGESATLRGQSPGRTTVFVEYTAPGGKTAKQSQPGSCVKLISVNGGAALPKLGLYDAKGQRRSPARTVPLQAEPSGDLLNFTPAQPIASVVPQGDSLQLQGTREGKTTVQARTQCGQPTGSLLALEVVPCDDEVIAELKQQIAAVRKQMDQNQQQVDQVLHDPEFNRAAREVAGDTRKLAWDTARAIVSTIGVGGKISSAAGSAAVEVSSGASTASTVMTATDSAIKIMNDDIGGAAISTGLKAVSNYTEGVAAAFASAESALRTLIGAGDSAQKFGQDLGTLDGVADRIAELERLRDQEMFDFNVLDKRLKGVCKYKGSGTKAPGTQTGGTSPSSDNPSNGPASGPPSQPSGPDTPSTTDSNPPVGPDNPPTDQPPPWEPPTTDDSTASLARSSNHCGQGSGLSSQPNQLAAGLKNLAASAKTFGAGPLASFQNSLRQWQQVLSEVKSAAQLPDAQRREQMRELLPRVQSILPEAQAFGQAGQSFLDTIGGCPAKLPPAILFMAQKAKQPVP